MPGDRSLKKESFGEFARSKHDLIGVDRAKNCGSGPDLSPLALTCYAISWVIRHTGADGAAAAERTLNQALADGESEVVGLIASGKPHEDIIHGIHKAVADRTQSLVGRIGLAPELTMTGGVAKNTGLIEVLGERLGVDLNIPDEPQIAGALGAALIARDRAAAT